MALPYDATIKELAQLDPLGFLGAFDHDPGAPIRLLNVDLSTVTTAADVVVGVGDPLKEVIHIEGQTGPDEDLPFNVLAYNVLLYRRYRVPVHSLVLLLRKQAHLSNLTGAIRYEPRPGKGYLSFGFEVIRLWEYPVEAILRGRLGLLPLAPLCRLPTAVPLEAGLGPVLQEVVRRLEHEAANEQVRKLLAATYIFTGLRVSRTTAKSLFQGVRVMRDSDTFQGILDEGEVRGLHNMLLLQGRKRFGEPDEATRVRLLALEDIDTLHELCERILDATSWQEILPSRS